MPRLAVGPMKGTAQGPATSTGKCAKLNRLNGTDGERIGGACEMGKEIERKFLVKGNEWRDQIERTIHTSQGYLASGSDCTVRVRLQQERAFLTVKGKTEGMTRPEYEYEIPAADAREMLDALCPQPYIEKIRYEVRYAGKKWEVDEFLRENEGLIMAEVELESEDEQIELPSWAGEEVTDDPRYSNACLAKNPYPRWGKK